MALVNSKFQFAQLLSNYGGNLSIFIGFSAISLCELLVRNGFSSTFSDKVNRFVEDSRGN